MPERTYTGWFVFAVVFIAFAGVFAVLALLAEGDADAAADAAIDFANLMMLVGIAFVLLPVGIEAIYQIHERTGRLAWLLDEDADFDVVEHVVISSDDAYDYADQLDDGEAILEDKRTGECYLAERRGDADEVR